MLPCALESIKMLKCEEVTFDVVNKAYIYYWFFFLKRFSNIWIFTLIYGIFKEAVEFNDVGLYCK